MGEDTQAEGIGDLKTAKFAEATNQMMLKKLKSTSRDVKVNSSSLSAWKAGGQFENLGASVH